MTPPDPGFSITLNGLLIVWQLLGTPLLGIITMYYRSNNKQLCEITKHLRAINGRVTLCEAWAVDHQERDEERMEGVRRQFTEIRQDIHGHHPGRGVGP